MSAYIPIRIDPKTENDQKVTINLDLIALAIKQAQANLDRLSTQVAAMNTGYIVPSFTVTGAFSAQGGLFRTGSTLINGTARDRGYGIFGPVGSGQQMEIDPFGIQGMNGTSPASIGINTQGAGANVFISKAGSTTQIAGLTTLVQAVKYPIANNGSSSVTLGDSHYFLTNDTTSGSITANLPDATTCYGRVYTILKTDTSGNTLTIDANGSQTIGGALTIVLGGIGRLSVLSDSANWQIVELYDEGRFTATLTGCTTAPTVTARYVRYGMGVDLIIPNVTATSNTTDCTFTGLPAYIQAVRTIHITIPEIEDNGLFNIGSIRLGAASDTLTLYRITGLTTGNTSLFTNSGTKGLSAPIGISYTLQ